MTVRVTATIDRAPLRALDRRTGKRSRSRPAVARETVAYYRALSGSERLDDASWDEIATVAAEALWPRAPRHRRRR